MESIARRYFWIINLLLLMAIAFLGARVVNNVLAEKIVSLPTKPAASKSTVKLDASQVDSAAWARTIIDRNLFNANPPEPEVADPEDGGDADGEANAKKVPDGVPPGPDDDCKNSESKISLMATMMAEPAEWSMAVVDDGESEEDRLARIGMQLGEHTLVAIHRNRIVLTDGGAFECVEIGERKGGGRRKSFSTRPATNTGPAKPTADIKDGIKKVGKNSYEIDRSMLDEQLADLSTLARQARVIPHYRDGKPQGFKVVGVRPGSLYSHIGIRSGDILKGVNDEAINSPNKALELFEKLKNSDAVNLDLERRGREVKMDYTIK
ncbi:MAG: hypothetical protein H6702_01970 [Myxococcales bacterium]|nr:hypothetical protein [Myxococcales bacterium]